MDKKMFCFQCEQTIGCSGCTGNSGVCGKTADTAKLQDELTGALIGLARAVDSTTAVSKKTSQVIIEGLFTTVTNVNFDNASIESMIQKVRAEEQIHLGIFIIQNICMIGICSHSANTKEDKGLQRSDIFICIP